MGFCRGTLLRCIRQSKKEEIDLERSATQFFSSPSKSPRSQASTLHPLSPPSSLGLWPAWMNGSYSCLQHPHVPPARRLVPSHKLAGDDVWSRLCTLFFREQFSTISRNSYNWGRCTAVPGWYGEISLTGLNQKTSVFLLSVRKQNVFFFFFASGKSEERNLWGLQTQRMLQDVSQPRVL